METKTQQKAVTHFDCQALIFLFAFRVELFNWNLCTFYYSAD